MAKLKCFTVTCAVIVVILVVLECANSQGLTTTRKGYYQVPTIPPRSKSSSKKPLTCACGDEDNQAICASNGITYKNSCKFECAQKKVPRLRKVSNGSCGSTMTRQQYWNSGNRGKAK